MSELPKRDDRGNVVIDANARQPIVIQLAPPRRFSWLTRLLAAGLVISLLFNLVVYSTYEEYYTNTHAPIERYHSGSRLASNRIAVIKASGTIMPPLTERLLEMIQKAKDDSHVKGVLLVVDSPGGLVADSHEIYHRLKELSEQKPVYVQMKRLAASGGYYIAMGAGPEARIFAEPTTWTGSIGVILPHFDVSQLAEKHGVVSDSIKTGEFKDTLNPLREMTDRERDLWRKIIDQSFAQFIEVIDSNRANLDEPKIRELATGQVYTAQDAKQSGLVDEIGFEEDALKALQDKLGLKDMRIVKYESPPGLLDVLLGTVQAKQENPLQLLLEASVPRAMYYFSWAPPLVR